MGNRNSAWIQKHRKDPYIILAKRKGYRSRSAFKLLHITKAYGIIKRGQKIVDLGAAPGGWIQVARNLVGDKGQILGIDKAPIKDFIFDNVRTLELDVSDESIVDSILEESGKVDNVISDLSISMSGIRNLDVARQIYLAEISFEIASKILVVHGNFIVKIFESPEAQQFSKRIKKYFRNVKFFKPQSSKSESSEVYFIALDFQELPDIRSNSNSKH